MFNTSVSYIDTLSGLTSTEVIRLSELHFFLEDELRGEIKILEVAQSFDDWETMEVLFSAE